MHIVTGHNHPMEVEDARAFEDEKRIWVMTTTKPNPHARCGEWHLLFKTLMSLSHYTADDGQLPNLEWF